MTKIQAKIKQALDLLVEVRLMARAGSDEYYSKRSISRYFNKLSTDLSDNVSTSLGSLARHLEGNPPEVNSQPSQEEIDLESAFLYRFDKKYSDLVKYILDRKEAERVQIKA